MSATAASGVSGSSAPTSAAGGSAPPPAAPTSGSSPSNVRQSIFEAVDGAGVEPSLPSWQTKSEEKPKRAPKPKAEAPGNQALQTPQQQQQDASTVDPVHPDVMKFFENELNPQPQESGEGEAETEAGDEQPSERAQNRFQVLANRAKAAEESAQRATQAHEAVQGHVNQLTEGFNQLRVQNAQLTTALQMMMQRQQPQHQQEVDPATEFRNNLRDETLKQLSPQLQKALQQRDEKISKLENFIHERDAKQQSTVNQQKYLSESDAAARTVALAGITAEDMTPQLLADTQEMVMATAWGHRTDMENAAKIVRQRTMRLALAFIKAQSQANRAKMSDRQNAPAGVPGANANARGNAEPSWNQIKESGSKNGIEFMMRRDGLIK